MAEIEKERMELSQKMQEGDLLARAEGGDAEAQRYVGDCYYYGCGVEQSRTEALRWYHLAADKGDAEAQYLLGICYLWGSPGIVRDMQTAKKWLHLAADQGVAEAQAELDYLK